MWRIGAVILAVLAGCDEATSAQPDARLRPDAEVDESRTPFTTTGTTPDGDLSNVRYLDVYFAQGFCMSGYYVGLYSTNAASSSSVLDILIPVESSMPPGATISAMAWLPGDLDPSTGKITFEVNHVDLPGDSTQPLHIAGRVTASSFGWMLDFSIDAVTPPPHTCI